MATVKRFEELEVWKLASVQCNEFYAIAQSGVYSNDGDLRSQMNRSSASVMDNIAEGFERHTRSDFRHFLVMAKSSNGEFRSQLHRMMSRNMLTREHHQHLVLANELLGKKLFAFISYLTSSGIKDKSKANSMGTSFLSESDMLYNIESEDGYTFPEELLFS